MKYVWDLVIADIQSTAERWACRNAGDPLSSDTLTDSYHQAMQLCVSLRQLIYERDSE